MFDIRIVIDIVSSQGGCSSSIDLLVWLPFQWELSYIYTYSSPTYTICFCGFGLSNFGEACVAPFVY
jgi:hypothetical protein